MAGIHLLYFYFCIYLQLSTISLSFFLMLQIYREIYFRCCGAAWLGMERVRGGTLGPAADPSPALGRVGAALPGPQSAVQPAVAPRPPQRQVAWTMQ